MNIFIDTSGFLDAFTLDPHFKGQGFLCIP